MPVYRLLLCYDGTRYRGWQKQGNTPDTLQEKLETLLSRVLKESIEVQGCGRTDAGVHARRQTCSFRTAEPINTETVLNDIRQYLPEDIGALSLSEAGSRFHARLSALEKTYVYRIRVSDTPDVFSRKYVYRYPCKPDLNALRAAAKYLTGTHDFTAFTSDRRVRTGKKSGIRTVYEISAELVGEDLGELRLTFRGDGFLYNEVRILAGTLLNAALGKTRPEDIPLILDSRDREQAGPTLPPQGLILWDESY